MAEAAPPRNAAIDVAKGLGIVLVVAGHSEPVGWAGTLPRAWVDFHMPLFFLLAGVCFNPERHPSLTAFVWLRAGQLLLPGVAFSLLLALAYPGTADRLAEMARHPHFLDSCWFLGSLFVVAVLYWLLHRLLRSDARLIAAAACLSLMLGLWLSPHREWHISHLAFPAALFFYTAGNLLRGWLLRPAVKGCAVQCAVLAVATLALCVWSTHETLQGTQLGLGMNFITSSNLAQAAFGIAAVLAASECLTSVNARGGAIAFLGRNSLVIMATHYYFVSTLGDLMPGGRTPLNMLLIQPAVWGGALLCVYVVNRWCPWLIGRRP